MTTLYPALYGTAMVDMDTLMRIFGTRLHLEFHRRLFAWIESMNGLIGIGQTYRAVQPVKPGFAEPGKSFHELQLFASGSNVVSAVDLVAVAARGNPNPAHRSPTWAESSTAPAYGLHTFITNEPWHMQCIETRGWQTWVNAGRPDPQHFTLPDEQPQPQENDEMLTAIAAIYAPNELVHSLVPNAKTFMLLPDGSTEHASGPDVEYATLMKLPFFTIQGVEHYEQIEKRSHRPAILTE